MTGRGLLGVDVGGTGIKALLVDAAGAWAGRWRRPTPHGDTGGERTAQTVAELVSQARSVATGRGFDVAAVGLVVPGVVEAARGVCRLAVNLGWKDLPIRQMVAKRVGLPVAFGHDVRAGALAEARTGAAAGLRGLAMFLPVGTGISAAYTRGGEPFELGPAAGEVGQIVLRRGPGAGLRVEEVASAAGIARRVGRPNALAVAEAVRAGDPAAVAAWREAVEVLADVVAWSAATLDPEVIVVGGGLSAAGDLLFRPLRDAVSERVDGIVVPSLRAAVHGDRAAMVGAILLAGDLVGAGPRGVGRHGAAEGVGADVPTGGTEDAGEAR
ncbi:MAG TPA: ROK family protein [Microbacteriaceae bacterium]|nr:ROK family protein [Microbacteriaceae bacterium]